MRKRWSCLRRKQQLHYRNVMMKGWLFEQTVCTHTGCFNLNQFKGSFLHLEYTLLYESALLVKEKSFVTLYTDFFFNQLKENAIAAKGKFFSSLVS